VSNRRTRVARGSRLATAETDPSSPLLRRETHELKRSASIEALAADELDDANDDDDDDDVDDDDDDNDNDNDKTPVAK